jgi:NADH:ubiquinone oxidoreductase subunit H
MALRYLDITFYLCNAHIKRNNAMLFLILNALAKILGIVVPLLVAVAYLTLAERKVMASMQRRKGHPRHSYL